jgi:signal transduction histidine kinase
VASILTLAEVLEDGGLPREKERDYASRIAGEGRRLARLLESVLDVGRIERGSRTIEMVEVKLSQAVAPIVESFRETELAKRAGEILFDDGSQGVMVCVDPGALAQIVTNLLSNAVKYSPEGAPVVVRLSVDRERKEARVSVIDRGRGMTEEESGRLFVPFYRARPEDSRATGVGLGLVIAHELARLMAGRIEVKSAPREGSTFAVVLPVVGGSP